MTPLYKIKSSDATVYAKLENQNPTGTHKDRSMSRWISHYSKRGVSELAISSSGNSAISAAKYCDENNIKLHVFLSPAISEEKLGRIKAYKNIALSITRTPNKDSFRFCKENGIANLRASKDDAALDGYKDIALELIEQLPGVDNIFIPTSSGTTLEGIYLGFKEKRHIPPAFFVVQTAKVHPIASYFDKDFIMEKTSSATAIVDRIAYRKDRVIDIIKETGGWGFVISNEELEEAQALLLNQAGWQGQAPSGAWHATLALAGFLKWQKQNSAKAKRQISVCLFTD